MEGKGKESAKDAPSSSEREDDARLREGPAAAPQPDVLYASTVLQREAKPSWPRASQQALRTHATYQKPFPKSRVSQARLGLEASRNVMIDQGMS